MTGRVCFHLAEHGEGLFPFRFFATYASSTLEYWPLGHVIRRIVAQRDLETLQSLFFVIDRSQFVRELSVSGALFRLLTWSPSEAHRFFCEIKLYEQCGVVVRAPEWCRQNRSGVQVSVKLGQSAPAQMGLHSLLDFSVGVTVHGESLSNAEWQALRETTDKLVRIRGEWVNREEIEQLEVLEREGSKIRFVDGARLLAGISRPLQVKVEAGDWFARALGDLKSDENLGVNPGPAFGAVLRPYQQAGVDWLYRRVQSGFGACLADDMGLGKSVQILALLSALRQEGAIPDRSHLLVLPASLLGNWQAEIEKFSPYLRMVCAHPSAIGDLRELSPWRLCNVDLVLTTYGVVCRTPWMLEYEWGLVILDEAQAIKSPATRQSNVVKQLRSLGRIALTGTPIENRLSDLWSLFDFLTPGLLGSFDEFQKLCQQMRGTSSEESDYSPLREIVRPYILRRLKSDKSVAPDLPDKTERYVYCSLTPVQAALYQQAVDELSALLRGKGLQNRQSEIVTFLLRFKQICNHPSHWLGDQIYAPKDSGKFGQLRDLCIQIAEKGEKALVFTQYRELCSPLSAFLSSVFGTQGLVLHGGTPVADRRRLVERFQTDSSVPFFVLSLKAGGTGLTLTQASHVVHFDRWWNPAIENQATDRTYRIGQHKNVLVHKFVCRGTIEEKIDRLIESKKALSRELLADDGESSLTELSDSEIIRLVSLDLKTALEESK